MGHRSVRELRGDGLAGRLGRRGNSSPISGARSRLRDGEEERAIARAAATLVAAALGDAPGTLPETAKRWLARQEKDVAEAMRQAAVAIAREMHDHELEGSLGEGNGGTGAPRRGG